MSINNCKYGIFSNLFCLYTHNDLSIIMYHINRLFLSMLLSMNFSDKITINQGFRINHTF